MSRQSPRPWDVVSVGIETDAKLVGPVGTIIVALYLMGLATLLVYGILIFWPAPGSPTSVRFLWFSFSISDEARLIIVVVISGALGSSVHAIRSLYWYVGHQSFKRNWILMYFLLPFGGATLALASYVIIRGGFFQGSATVSQVNPFSFAAVAVLVGLFSVQAYTWLKEVASTFFKAAPQGKDRIENAQVPGEGEQAATPGSAGVHVAQPPPPPPGGSP